MTSVLPSGIQETDRPAFELEIARLIAEVVNLDCPPEQVDPTAPLFGDGLGLDSTDLRVRLDFP